MRNRSPGAAHEDDEFKLGRKYSITTAFDCHTHVELDEHPYSNKMLHGN